MPPAGTDAPPPPRAAIEAPARQAAETVVDLDESATFSAPAEAEPIEPVVARPAAPEVSVPPPPAPPPPKPAAVAVAAVAVAADPIDEPAVATIDPPLKPVEQPAEPVKIRVRTKSPLDRIRPDWLKNIGFREIFSGLSVLVGPVFFLATCLALTALVVFRTQIVAVHPDFAGLYGAIGLDVNLRGLAFEKIETLREVENGQPVLVVEGAIVNTTHDTREVPALRFALRGNDAQELYAWSLAPKTAALAAGDSFRFRTRLAAPPDQAADVQIRFVERRNLQAGLP